MAVVVGRKKGKVIELTGGDGQLVVSVPLIYIVYDSTGTQREADVLFTPGLPKVNEVFEIDGLPFAVACKKKSAKQWPSNNKYWEITCECDNEPFTTNSGSGGGSGDQETDTGDPTTWVPIVSLSYEQVDEVEEFDIYGQPIQNSAQRPYQSAFTTKRLITCLEFTQYDVGSLKLSDLLDRNEKINESTYLGDPRGSWMLTVEDCDKGYKNGVLCWKTDYKLRYKKRTLSTSIVKVYDSGLGAWASLSANDINNAWQPVAAQLDFVDLQGNPVQDKNDNQFFGKLDADGIRVAGASQGTATTFYRMHEIYEYADFSTFLRINQEQ